MAAATTRALIQALSAATATMFTVAAQAPIACSKDSTQRGEFDKDVGVFMVLLSCALVVGGRQSGAENEASLPISAILPDPRHGSAAFRRQSRHKKKIRGAA